MANKTSKPRAKTVAAKTAPVREEPKVTPAPVETKPAEESYEFEPTDYVTVKSGFHGLLVYVSSRTGEQFQWDDFGAEQEMELRELRNAKSSQKDFFINNWFMFDDPRVVEYLGVEQYYKHSLGSDNFDDLFTKSPDEIRRIIGELSDGQRESVEYRAREMITSGDIDSLKVISALEDSLGVEFLER